MRVKISVRNLNIWFGRTHALKDVSLDISCNEILTIIGPANSGKTTFLRMLNRLNDLEIGFRSDGSMELDGCDIRQIDDETLRKKIGMVFALPTVLPLSVFDNVAYGPRVHGLRDIRKLKQIAENSLKEAYIWEEVKDRLNESAYKLSGGQQQRLCIARALAIKPEVILFDEPCSGLDPISTAKVEEAMLRLKKNYTIVLVTNNVKQAARAGDTTAFFLMGELIESDKTDRIFTAPKNKETEDYISGRFG